MTLALWITHDLSHAKHVQMSPATARGFRIPGGERVPAPIPDTKRQAILDDIRAGKSRNAIAREHGVRAGTVTKIAQENDLRFARSATKHATAASVADTASRRAALAERLIRLAELSMDQAIAELGEASSRDTAVVLGIAVDKHRALVDMDRDPEGLTAVARARPGLRHHQPVPRPHARPGRRRPPVRRPRMALGQQEDARALTDSEYSERLRAWVDGLGIRPEYTIVAPSAKSFRVQLHRDGITSTLADNEAVDGIRTTASLFATGRLLVSSACPELIKEIPGYAWDPDASEKGEDKPLKIQDHGVDALRYGVRTRV
ncbi:hypothetical protein [Streptosporangium roseum]|uniref:hypothetical protein n=1 Tax=Streptosporangium roseum TaxID=2001 RepID=UPI003325765B